MFSNLIKKFSKMVINRASKGHDDSSRKRKDSSMEKKPKAKKVKKVKVSYSKPAYQLENEDIGLNPFDIEQNPSMFPLEVQKQI